MSLPVASGLGNLTINSWFHRWKQMDKSMHCSFQWVVFQSTAWRQVSKVLLQGTIGPKNILQHFFWPISAVHRICRLCLSLTIGFWQQPLCAQVSSSWCQVRRLLCFPVSPSYFSRFQVFRLFLLFQSLTPLSFPGFQARRIFQSLPPPSFSPPTHHQNRPLP